jgi:hypothetical protein
MRKIERISISVADRERLERLVRDRNTPQKVVWRARIVLLDGDGVTARGLRQHWARACLRSAAGGVAMCERRGRASQGRNRTRRIKNFGGPRTTDEARSASL